MNKILVFTITSLILLRFLIFSCYGETNANQSPNINISRQKFTAEEIINKLQLVKMDEGDCGGYFKEIYRSLAQVKTDKQQNACSIIYHLIRADYIVPWHKITSEEIFIFLAGSPQIICYITPEGRLVEATLGNDYDKGEIPMQIIPPNCWMSETLIDKSENSWSLLGVSVVPGFDISHYSATTADKIYKEYPALEKRIKEIGLIR